MRHLGFAVTFWALVFVTAVAAGAKKAEYLRLDPVKPSKIFCCKPVQVTVVAHVQAGFHIQANPAAEPNLIPTTVFVKPEPGIEPLIPVFPAGKKYRLKGSDRDILTYDGKVEIKIPLLAGEKVAPGTKFSLVSRLRYQPCDDKICYFPQTVEFKIPVEVGK